MYCPNCGTSNEGKPSYCRSCGQSLAAAQLVVDGQFDTAIAKFKKSEDLLGLGLLIFGLFMAGSIVMLFLEGPRPFSFAVLLALIVCTPLVLTGLIKLNRARRQLDPTEPQQNRVNAAKEMSALPPRSTDPLEITPEMRGSITEHTTVHLNQKKPTA